MIVFEWFLFIFAWLFFLSGTFIIVSCFVGLLNNKDFFIRMHAIKISNIYGISFILFANSLLSKSILIFLQLLLIILVNILTTIVITHAICRTALLDGIKYKGISRRKYNKLLEEAEKQAIEEELKRNS